MNVKILLFLLIISSLIGYLEWGSDQARFLFQVEYELIGTLFTNPASVLHPFTLLPLIGQILLAVTLFQKVPNKWLVYSGIAGLGLLLGFMLVIGGISFNLKILGSTIPFMILAVLTIRELRNLKSA